MIVTNDFVMLNLPKTGSSFARAAIKEIYEQRQARKSIMVKALRRLVFKQFAYYSGADTS